MHNCRGDSNPAETPDAVCAGGDGCSRACACGIVAGIVMVSRYRFASTRAAPKKSIAFLALRKTEV